MARRGAGSGSSGGSFPSLHEFDHFFLRGSKGVTCSPQGLNLFFSQVTIFFESMDVPGGMYL